MAPTGMLLAFLFLLLTFPAPGRSEISNCIGPQGELLFTDRECPPGYSLQGTTPATPSDAGGSGPEGEGESALSAAGASDALPPGAKDRAGDPVCREGIFSTENHATSYDVYFTNASREECRTVSAYCLCSVSFGLYRQSREITVTGSFAAGARTRIASISPTGPSGGGIDWSWCKFRN